MDGMSRGERVMDNPFTASLRWSLLLVSTTITSEYFGPRHSITIPAFTTGRSLRSLHVINVAHSARAGLKQGPGGTVK